MLTEIYMLFIIDLMIPHNGMNSINPDLVVNGPFKIEDQIATHKILRISAF